MLIGGRPTLVPAEEAATSVVLWANDPRTLEEAAP